MNILNIHQEILSGYRSYIESFIEIFDDDIRLEVEGRLEDGTLWPEPLVQFNPAYQRALSIDNLVQEKTLCPETATVRLLAFDVACLLDSYIRNTSLLPGLLIHDSPREADLSVDIYHEIFRLFQRMESESKTSEFPFQYIVTTTEPPPEELRREPWLLDPVLNATEAKRRFLGVDV